MIKKISITGGIGSGKSTVVKMLQNLGYCVWDADIFAAEAMTRPHVEEEIKALLGAEAYSQPGVLNREWVRARIFSDSTSIGSELGGNGLKNGLEDILHPVIQQIFTHRLHILESQNVSCWIFYEASLIFEKKRHDFFDANILVTADDRKRIQRIRKTKNLSTELIQQIIAQQMPERDKKRIADFVIENSSTHDQLERKVVKLIQFLVKYFPSAADNCSALAQEAR